VRSPNAPASIFGEAERATPICPILRERDERLESLKALTGHLAHDFNNSLVPLLGYAALIKEELGPDASVFEYASKLETAARKTEGFLSTVLLAVRPHRRFAPKATNLTELVRGTLDQWLASLPPSPAIEAKAELAPCTLRLDENHWRHVLQHLLANARFALAAGGKLLMTLQPMSLSAQRAEELGLRGTSVFELAVQDNGIGMTKNVLRRACEPFFTTRPKGQAAGLGLTIVHSVVQLHGGQMSIESVEAIGTKVVLWIPSLTSAE
jgi:signal transduction histidine kinase